MRLYDAHCHYHFPELKTAEQQIAGELEKIGLAGAVVNGTEQRDWPGVAAYCARHPWAIPAFGLHPWHLERRAPDWLNALERCLDAAPRASIGECGLDRWMPGHDLALQREILVEHLRLATRRELPVSIHCIRAWGALHEVLTQQPLPAQGFLVHAYSGSAELVGPLVKLGGYFSFSAYFLHERKALQRQNFAKVIPMKRILVETDAPSMLPPVEHCRWRLPNESTDAEEPTHPANLQVAYEALAALRGEAPEKVANQVEENFRRLFQDAAANERM